MKQQKKALLRIFSNLLPDDFLTAVDLSGMYYDEFLSKVMKENECQSDLEIFRKWETIKKNYLGDNLSSLTDF